MPLSPGIPLRPVSKLILEAVRQVTGLFPLRLMNASAAEPIMENSAGGVVGWGGRNGPDNRFAVDLTTILHPKLEYDQPLAARPEDFKHPGSAQFSFAF